MESKSNYILVGLFVLLLSAALAAFVYWLGKYGAQQEYDYYHVFMSESVAGLSADASVKYRGVEVGRVDAIGLNPDNSEEVKLVLQIQRGTPIKQDTIATLKSFGLTGLTYLELLGGSKNSPLLLSNVDGIPTITAMPSTFTRVYASVDHLTAKASAALDKFNTLLSDDNLHHFTALLEEAHQLAKESRQQLQGVEALIENGIMMEERVAEAFDNIEAASLSIKQMADALKISYADLGQNVGQDVHQSLEGFNQLIEELDGLAGDLKQTMHSIQQTPGDLLFKRSQTKPGPGE